MSSYNRKRPGADDILPSRKQPSLDFSDLPTHLPNTQPTEAAPTAPDAGPSPPQKQSSKPEEPIFIEGTNITLQTDEDIANWIAERKKNWPSRNNIKAKLSQQPPPPPPADPAAPKKTVCKFFGMNKRCKFGAKCKNSHDSSSNRTVINGLPVVLPQRYKKELPEKESLFTKLVQRDLYKNENNIVLDFLLYLDSNGSIDRNAHV